MKRDLPAAERALQADLRAFRRDRPPVLLLGGLNITRALGLAGIPVIVASPEAAPEAAASRYCAGRCLLPPLAQRELVLETLLAAGEKLAAALGTRVPLFYGDDDYLALVQDSRAALDPYFLLPINDPATAAALIDKQNFQALCERHALPVPRRIAPEELERWHGPVLVKPKHKRGWHGSELHAQLFKHGKALVFESGAAAAAQPLVARHAGELSLQEYVPGDDRSLWSFHGFATQDAKLLASFTGRKIRTYPALTGDSSYLELAHDDALAAAGREVAEKLALKGPFKIDFKRDARTGRFRLLEVNARFTLWHYLGAKNGVNLAAVAYHHLIDGKKEFHVTAAARYRWLCLPLDWRAFRALSARGELDAAGWLGSLAVAPLIYDLFAWSDPLPFARHSAARVRRGAARVCRAAARVPRALVRRMQRWRATAS